MRATARSYGPSTSRPSTKALATTVIGVLEVVEHEHGVGQQKGHLGQAEVVRRRVGKVFEAPHEVVAEVADEAAGERRQGGAAAPLAGDR